ncbi:phage virion morphogenesis protein [Pseudomonas mosselii]|uniref:phage virion morphogenesis protein n=1 Tax=Pseudomonas mosselii TaxID=78327 RepID=UPI0018D99933|nr:phage virion morphogenesis protein [Pseudomonas mosselii]MBH3308924.1 phage virion morphogenesis protein [Pseudomonas mosselii]MBH3325334.1 phage virion morphogenesis protein [Pseudomonas mosselii]
MADLEALEHWVSPLLQRIEPAARTKLARTIAKDLRRSQQQRVIAQRNPDGSPYAPRKPRQLRGKKGRVRRKVKMFQKIRTATYLKAVGDASSATIGFTGRVARIARTHQEGLRDRAAVAAPTVLYEQRQLLGFTAPEAEKLKDFILSYLTE